MTYQDDVREFHKKAKQRISYKPTIPDFNERLLRQALISEEHNELQYEIRNVKGSGGSREENLAKLLSEAVDLVYVVMGTCVAFGLPFDEAWNAIHKANMDKFKDGINKRPDGKLLKPKDWEPADILKIIQDLK